MDAQPTWTQISCITCGGHGVVADYGNGEDFYGAAECRDCNGSGSVWKSPTGRIAQYPGGRFVGRAA